MKSSPTIVTLHCHSRNIGGFGEANDELLREQAGGHPKGLRFPALHTFIKLGMHGWIGKKNNSNRSSTHPSMMFSGG